MWFSHAGFPDWLGCYFIIMLGSDRVLQVQVRMLWSSGDELDDKDVFPYLIYISAVWGQVIKLSRLIIVYCTLIMVCILTVQSLYLKSIIIYYFFLLCCKILCCCFCFFFYLFLLSTLNDSGFRHLDLRQLIPWMY